MCFELIIRKLNIEQNKCIEFKRKTKLHSKLWSLFYSQKFGMARPKNSLFMNGHSMIYDLVLFMY